MFGAVARIFRTPDLRRKIGFTLAIVAIFRLGSFIPAPFVDFEAVQACLAGNQGTSGLYELVNLFSGGALLQLSIFALGIMPYITASIIVQLLRVVIPHFETLYKEGQSGQAKLTQYTRYLTIALGVLQSTTLITVARSGALFGNSGVPECSALIITDEWYSILPHGHHHDGGHRHHHVDGRAHHRARHRQRHVAPDLHLDRRPVPHLALVDRAVARLRDLPASCSRSASCSSSRSSSSSSRSGESRCSTPSGWSVAAPTAATTPTSRSRSTWPASCPSSSPRRCSTCPR